MRLLFTFVGMLFVIFVWWAGVSIYEHRNDATASKTEIDNAYTNGLDVGRVLGKCEVIEVMAADDTSSSPAKNKVLDMCFDFKKRHAPITRVRHNDV